MLIFTEQVDIKAFQYGAHLCNNDIMVSSNRVN